MEDIDQPSEIVPVDRIVVSSGDSGLLTELFLDLSQRHRQLELQAEPLRHEVGFVIGLIHRMEPCHDQVTSVAAKRLADALQKFKAEEVRHDDKAA